MINAQASYLVDEDGRRKVVVVSWSAWMEIQEALEELADIRAYEEGRTSAPGRCSS